MIVPSLSDVVARSLAHLPLRGGTGPWILVAVRPLSNPNGVPKIASPESV